MTGDRLLARLAESAAFLPDDQAALIAQLDELLAKTPPPAGLSPTGRFGWAFTLLPLDTASDFAGAIGVALMAGAILAGHPAAEAQKMAFSTIEQIARVAAAFTAEQRIAAASPKH
jgi:hypothetical protein